MPTKLEGNHVAKWRFVKAFTERSDRWPSQVPLDFLNALMVRVLNDHINNVISAQYAVHPGSRVGANASIIKNVVEEPAGFQLQSNSVSESARLATAENI